MIELKIEYNGLKYNVDLTEEVNFSLNFSIADVRDISKRNTTYSKTITIPGTKNNNNAFSNIFELGSVPVFNKFNPNKKVKAVLLYDDQVILDGFLQLLQIIDLDGLISYEVIILGSLSSIYAEMRDLFLNDLDLSEYNHFYSSSNIKNSWEKSIVKDGTTHPFILGNGYVYPMLNYGEKSISKFKNDNIDRWSIGNFIPAVYVKTYIDKIFKKTGFKYKSKFFESQYFKSLIIPGIEKVKLSQQQIDNKKIFVQGGLGTNKIVTIKTETDITNGVSDNWGVSPNPLVYEVDPGNNFNFSTRKIQPTAGTTYDTVCEIDIKTKFSMPAGSGVTWKQWYNQDYTDYKTGISGDPNHPGVVYKLTAYINNIFNQSITFAAGDNGIPDFTKNDSNPQIFDQKFSLSIPKYFISSGSTLHFELTVLNTFRMRQKISGKWSVYQTPVECQMTGGYIEAKAVIGEFIKEGDFLDLNSAIPQIKCSDLFSTITKMFNLYIIDDKEEPDTLIIEPRNDFYSTFEFDYVDWTHKRDLNSEFKQIPLGELDFKNYRFSYKQDKDFWNIDYYQTYNETFGEKNYLVDNDFINSEKTLDVLFSASPMTDHFGTGKIMPSFVMFEEDGTEKKIKPNPRLLFYGGFITNIKNTIWRFDGIDYVNYPYCGHLDNPYIAKEDLSFGQPKVFYTAPIQYTNSTLFEKYHSAQIQEFSNADSNIVEGYFYLTSQDIHNFDFRRLVFIDNQYFKVNKIIDFNPVENGLTKVELIKSLESIVKPKSQIIINDEVIPFDNFCPDDIQSWQDGSYRTPEGRDVSKECCDILKGVYQGGRCYWNVDDIFLKCPTDVVAKSDGTYKSGTKNVSKDCCDALKGTFIKGVCYWNQIDSPVDQPVDQPVEECPTDIVANNDGTYKTNGGKNISKYCCDVLKGTYRNGVCYWKLKPSGGGEVLDPIKKDPIRKEIVKTGTNTTQVSSANIKLNGDNNYLNKDVNFIDITGDDNIIGSDSERITISGNDNRVASKTRNITLLNSDNNIIESGLENVTLINTNNTIVKQSGVVMIDGIKIKNGELENKIDIVNGGFNEVQGLFGVNGINIIDGGFNAVRGFNFDSDYNLIDGNVELNKWIIEKPIITTFQVVSINVLQENIEVIGDDNLLFIGDGNFEVIGDDNLESYRLTDIMWFEINGLINEHLENKRYFKFNDNTEPIFEIFEVLNRFGNTFIRVVPIESDGVFIKADPIDFIEILTENPDELIDILG
jgi:hypothetical protein